MRSKNSKAISRAESEHLRKVKESGCAVCGAGVGAVVQAHHIQQGLHYTTVALCPDCHTGPMGIHGDKTMWRIFMINEMEALNETLRRVITGEGK